MTQNPKKPGSKNLIDYFLLGPYPTLTKFHQFLHNFCGTGL